MKTETTKLEWASFVSVTDAVSAIPESEWERLVDELPATVYLYEHKEHKMHYDDPAKKLEDIRSRCIMYAGWVCQASMCQVLDTVDREILCSAIWALLNRVFDMTNLHSTDASERIKLTESVRLAAVSALNPGGVRLYEHWARRAIK